MKNTTKTCMNIIGYSLAFIAIGSLTYLYKERNIEERIKSAYIKSLYFQNDYSDIENEEQSKIYSVKKGTITSLIKNDGSSKVEIEFTDESGETNKIKANEKDISLINILSRDNNSIYVSHDTIFVPEGVPINPIGKEINILDFKKPHKPQTFVFILSK